jgi:hydroxymethylglutaryl-CoA lyase
MGGTPDVLLAINPLPHVKYPVLVPNAHGLTAFLSLLSSHPHLRQSFTEIAIFTAASDAFNQRNTNCTIAESLARLAPVVKQAREEGLSVRGYVSMVVECPFEGKIAPTKVREVSERLMEMGCYEVSLGDTVGRGTPETVGRMLEEVKKGVDVGMLAGHVSVPSFSFCSIGYDSDTWSITISSTTPSVWVSPTAGLRSKPASARWMQA